MMKNCLFLLTVAILSCTYVHDDVTTIEFREECPFPFPESPNHIVPSQIIDIGFGTPGVQPGRAWTINQANPAVYGQGFRWRFHLGFEDGTSTCVDKLSNHLTPRVLTLIEWDGWITRVECILEGPGTLPQKWVSEDPIIYVDNPIQ